MELINDDMLPLHLYEFFHVMLCCQHSWINFNFSRPARYYCTVVSKSRYCLWCLEQGVWWRLIVPPPPGSRGQWPASRWAACRGYAARTARAAAAPAPAHQQEFLLVSVIHRALLLEFLLVSVIHRALLQEFLLVSEIHRALLHEFLLVSVIQRALLRQ